jgi:hypothetical protein
MLHHWTRKVKENIKKGKFSARGGQAVKSPVLGNTGKRILLIMKK